MEKVDDEEFLARLRPPPGEKARAVWHEMRREPFGHLRALYRVGSKKRGTGTSAVWRCVCDCGNTVDVEAAELRRGARTSCGCRGAVTTGLGDPMHALLDALRMALLTSRTDGLLREHVRSILTEARLANWDELKKKGFTYAD